MLLVDPPGPIAVGDFNNDGRPDLVTSNGGRNGTVSVLRNIQGPDFSVQASEVGSITGGQSESSFSHNLFHSRIWRFRCAQLLGIPNIRVWDGARLLAQSGIGSACREWDGDFDADY